VIILYFYKSDFQLKNYKKYIKNYIKKYINLIFSLTTKAAVKKHYIYIYIYIYKSTRCTWKLDYMYLKLIEI
jgi:uncharacterized protein YaaR (DUF327 family)